MQGPASEPPIDVILYRRDPATYSTKPCALVYRKGRKTDPVHIADGDAPEGQALA
jgi:hypothetical protein